MRLCYCAFRLTQPLYDWLNAAGEQTHRNFTGLLLRHPGRPALSFTGLHRLMLIHTFNFSPASRGPS